MKGIREINNILLIPPVINIFCSVQFRDFLPLGILTLATVLKKNGFHPTIYSPWKSLINEEDYREVATDILSHNPALIGFSTWCTTYPASLIIAKHIKSMNQGIPIIFGGPQATLSGKETLKEFGFVDFVMGGECDVTFPKFVNLILNGYQEEDLINISGLAFRTSSGKIIQNSCTEIISNLDELPVPSFRLLKPRNFLMLDVGRGCPFKCTFCSTSDFFSKTYRTKSPERIIHEMEVAYNKFRISRFSFSHDMFTLNKSFIYDLCYRLINLGRQNNRKYSWDCSARIDCITPELLNLMKEAGCHAIFFGIESGSDKIQRLIRKNLNISEVYKTAETCRTLGIEIHAAFILGFPEETEDDIEKTLRCIFNLITEGAFTQVSELSLLPGTPLFKQHKARLKFDGQFSNFSGCICGLEEIKMILKFPEIFSTFYYLPVDTIDRNSLFMMQNLINHLGEFRNTLFFLRELLKKDFEGTYLLAYAHKYLQNLKVHSDQGKPLITFLVKQLSDYLTTKKFYQTNPYIADVFAFESIQAMMLAKFTRWQMIKPKTNKLQFQNLKDCEISSMQFTPFWHLLSTSYALKLILPAENGWLTEKIKAKRGHYHYLVVAISEMKCNYIKINGKENQILTKVNNEIIGKNREEITKIPEGINLNTFWRKMKKLGVIEMKC